MSRRHERRATRRERDAVDPLPHDAESPAHAAPNCALCGRAIPHGVRASRHHLIPKLKGGARLGTVLLHQICHSAIHARFSEAELARRLSDVASLQREPGLAEFIAWVRKRPPGFWGRTRSQRG